MPRYLVERTFPDGLAIPTDSAGASAMLRVVDANAKDGVTWVHSYVSDDKKKTYCIYDGPDPEAIRTSRRPTVSRSTASRRSRCSTRTSTTDPSYRPFPEVTGDR